MAEQMSSTNSTFPKMPKLPDIELVSAKVHDAWMDSKRAAGVTSRKLESGEELMVPYDQLSEQAKDLDRGTVKAVYSALREAFKTDPFCFTG